MAENFNFVEVRPQPCSVPPVRDLEIDVPRSFELLQRPQKANFVGQYDPDQLLTAFSGEKSLLIQGLPIKLPYSPYFFPDMLASTDFAQAIVNHRFSTQKQDDMSMALFFDKSFVYPTGFARKGYWGLHIDDSEFRILNEYGRIMTCYIAVSGLPTIFYDGLNPSLTKKEIQEIADVEIHEEEDYNHKIELASKIYRRHIYPQGGYSFAPGSLVVFSGATPHEVMRAPTAQWRSMISCVTVDFPFEDANILKKNPPLYRWAKQNNSLALR